jgi:hypothetical protein
MSASDFLRRHGWQMRANHWEHPKFPDILHSFQSALLQTGMWLEQESPPENVEMLAGVRKILNDWATGKFSDRHYEAHKAMRRIQELNDAREVSEHIRREGKS